MADISKVLIGTIFSLIISSVIITWLLLQIFGISVAGLTIPNTLPASYSSTQNFLTDEINESILIAQAGSEWRYSEGVGRILVGKTWSGSSWTYLLITKILKDSNNIVTNHYKINNSIKQDYTIVLRYTGGSDTNEITIANDGVHLPTYLGNMVISSPLIVPYAGMNQIESADITTIYNDKDLTATIIFNGQQINIWGLNADVNPLGLFDRYYAGVASDTLGFTFEYFKTDNSIYSTEDVDVLSQIGVFLTVLAKLLFWNVDPIFLPNELNIILIKSQMVVIIVATAYFIRSGG